MIAQAIAAVSQHFKLGTYRLGVSGGKLRILAACYGVPSMPDAARQLIAAALAHRHKRDLSERPRAELDPIGYALIENCWAEAQVILDMLSNSSSDFISRNMFSWTSLWNRVFQETIDDTVELIRATCETSGFANADKAHKEKIAGWTLWQRYHLKSGRFKNCGERPAHEDAFVWKRNCALAHLAVEHEAWTNRIPEDWYQTEVLSPAQRLRVRGEDALPRLDKMPRFVIRTAVTNMQQYDRSEISPSPKEIEKITRGFGNTPCLSAIPSRNGLGRVVFEDVAAAAMSNLGVNDGATLAAAMVFGALPPNLIKVANFREKSSAVLVGTPLLHPTHGGLIDGNLLHVTERELWRAIPLGLGKGLIALNATGINEQERNVALESFLKEIDPGASIARLRNTLLFQVPVWWETTETFFNFGLLGEAESIPGWRSYITWVPQESQCLITKLLHRLDPFFAPDINELAYLPACGSPFTPQLGTVTEMFGVFERLCETIPADEKEWGDYVNAVAGLADFFYALFTFTRRIDASRPPAMFVDVSGVPKLGNHETIVVEKGFSRVIHTSEPAEKVLVLVKTALEKFEVAASKAGWNIASPELRPLAYYSIETTKKGEVTTLARAVTTKSEVKNALLDYEPTRKFGTLPWQAMRDFGSYVMRHSGEFSDWQINHLLDHFDARARSPLNRNSLRLPLRRSLNEKAAGVIYGKILGN